MLTHRGTQTIKTERLTLRQFCIEDAEAMYNNWANDERVTKFLTWPPHESVEATRELLKTWCEDYKKLDNYNWVIEFGGQAIGSITVVEQSERDEYAEPGYCIGHAYWGKGIMTEAAQAVIEFLFREVGFNRISISHAVKNPGSGRVAQKCGLKLEGTKREFFKSQNGEFLDINIYSILRSEYLA